MSVDGNPATSSDLKPILENELGCGHERILRLEVARTVYCSNLELLSTCELRWPRVLCLSSFPKGLRDPIRDLIPHPPEGKKLLFLRAQGSSRVLEAPVNDLSGLRQAAGKLRPGAADGAGLSGPIADGDRQIEYGIPKLRRGLGALAGDINSHLLHHQHGAGIDSGGDNPGAVGLVFLSIHGS